jgi:ceramide glucosyltransferase
VLVTVVFAALTLIGLGLLLWQFIAAWRFPLHRLVVAPSFFPPVTILKPLKDCDEHTSGCLRSWFMQSYPGPVQILLGVADENDRVCGIVRDLLKAFPNIDAELVITADLLGPNAKVSTLVQLMRRAKHEFICVSDADVRVPKDFLANAVAPLRTAEVGLVNCFYQLANPTTFAMRWEAIAINADFWSQVLQSNTLKPQDFALGAVMMTRRANLEKIGGFESLLEFLADDYQLGHRIARTGKRIELSPVVVECVEEAMEFGRVWKHQLRWARTIRACQPFPYFLSILGNVTLWATGLALFGDLGRLPPDSVMYADRAPNWMHALEIFQFSNAACIAFVVIVVRVVIAAALQIRLTRQRGILGYWWCVPIKDLFNATIWAASFLGNSIEWGGRKFRLTRGGRLVEME